MTVTLLLSSSSWSVNYFVQFNPSRTIWTKCDMLNFTLKLFLDYVVLFTNFRIVLLLSLTPSVFITVNICSYHLKLSFYSDFHCFKLCTFKSRSFTPKNNISILRRRTKFSSHEPKTSSQKIKLSYLAGRVNTLKVLTMMRRSQLRQS